MSDRDGIAIVGMACGFPGAPDVDAYWDLLRGGGTRSPATLLPRISAQISSEPKGQLRIRSPSTGPSSATPGPRPQRSIRSSGYSSSTPRPPSMTPALIRTAFPVGSDATPDVTTQSPHQTRSWMR